MDGQHRALRRRLRVPARARERARARKQGCSCAAQVGAWRNCQLESCVCTPSAAVLNGIDLTQVTGQRNQFLFGIDLTLIQFLLGVCPRGNPNDTIVQLLIVQLTQGRV